MKRHCFTGVFAAAALLVLAGCTGPVPTITNDDGTVRPVDEDFMLRFSNPKDKLVRYDMNFRLNSDGEGSIDERLRSVIYQQCLGPVGEGPDPKFWKLHVYRRDIDRVKKEVDRNGRRLAPMIATRTVTPDVTPNYAYDRPTNTNYFPVTDRGIFGTTNEAPFHRIVYDSLVYLTPVLPIKKVRAGSTWAVDIPVYAGADYFYPTKEWRRGNDFRLSYTARVDRVYWRGGERFARISWKCHGAFDTLAEPDDWPQNFHERQRIIHDVEASGRVEFNVDQGVAVSKSGQSTATFTQQIRISRVDRAGQYADPRWEKSVQRHRITWTCRLMGDDEEDPLPSRK